MIDFPASPTDGQIFSATNGVVYKWSAAYTSWLAQNPAPAIGGTGDFCAVLVGPVAISGTGSVAAGMPVVNGNAGGWYTVATGVYRPPAGRFQLFASMQANSSSNATNAIVSIRKNGTTIQTATDTSASANFQCYATAIIIADANGTDVFDVMLTGTAASSNGANITFGAFPLTGMQGPTGGAPGPVVGDFCATNSGSTAIPTAMATIALSVIRSGNSGGYYNTTTGRYTPPAGRYFLSASATAVGGAMAPIQLSLAKNGTSVGSGLDTLPTSGWSCPAIALTVDANGSDYFELQVQSNGVTGITSTPGGILFTAFPTQGMVGPQGPAGPAGVTQTVFFETGAMATGTGIIPLDDTIPQITEGDQYMTLAITPQSATSKLIIEVVFNGAPSASVEIIAALFQDATANALAAASTYQFTASGRSNLTFKHVMTSGTTNPTTFRVRAGLQSAGTLTFNGVSGARLYGGVMASSIVIREVP